MSYSGLGVLIPTRNRPDLAEVAIRSALEQLPASSRLVVSDNSGAANRTRLAASCDGLGDARLEYLGPETEMAMTEHWRWALDRMLEDPALSHVTVLTDRMAFRRGELERLAAIASANPDDVISYNMDHVDDRLSPPLLIQYPWSGRLWRLDSRLVLRDCSHGRFPPWIPRLLNAVVPRSALERVRARFGTVAGSIAPDYSFAFRFMGLAESFLYYDRSVLIAGGLERSIGSSIVRGEPSTDGNDFIRSLDRSLNEATPLPAVNAYPNPIFQAYYDARAESRSGALPDVDHGCYLAALARGTAALENEAARADAARVLSSAGWRGRQRLFHSALSLAEAMAYAAHPREFLRRTLWRRRTRLQEPGRLLRALLRSLRMLPPVGAGAAETVEFADARPVERVRRPVGIRGLLASPRPIPGRSAGRGRSVVH